MNLGTDLKSMVVMRFCHRIRVSHAQLLFIVNLLGDLLLDFYIGIFMRVQEAVFFFEKTVKRSPLSFLTSPHLTNVNTKKIST